MDSKRKLRPVARLLEAFEAEKKSLLCANAENRKLPQNTALNAGLVVGAQALYDSKFSMLQ
jgi:hypothetical protein